ncbi:MAG: methionyl-tRNA formyltransferase [bacterium]|nr:methionyl-tRNA formyltransferase [bacterium]
MRYKIIFFGTSNFAVPSVEILSKHHTLLTVVTSPNPSPVKIITHKLGIKVFEPVDPNSSDFLSILRDLEPDMICVAAYGHILSNNILTLPKLGAINLHPSLLPAYRGAAPIRWAIINGDKKTGVTTFLMDEKVDHGDILLQKDVEINELETFGELELKLSKMGAELLLETLNKFDDIKPITQPAEGVSYAPKITKELRQIDWSKGAVKIVNLIRALSPRPGAYTIFRGKQLEILLASPIESPGKPGRIEHAKDVLWVGTGAGCIELKLLKPEAKREQTGLDFINGYHPKVNEIMG